MERYELKLSDKKRGGKTLKILLATYWYFPHVGGVNQYINIIKEELELVGHDVDVFAHHPDINHYYIANKDLQINKMEIKTLIYNKLKQHFKQYLPQLNDWVIAKEIERYCFEMGASLINLEQYDLIHTQDIISTRALSRVKPERVPLIATIHGLLANEHLLSGDIANKGIPSWDYVKNEEYYGVTSADITIIPTQWLKEQFVQQIKVPEDHLEVMPYGMNIDLFLKEHKQDPYPLLNKPDKGVLILCPARLVPVKGHQVLIKALKKLKDKGIRFECWLAGDGELRKNLEQSVQQLDMIKQIRFLGNRADVPALMSLADIMILPSLQDNLPFSIMEAQIAGLPIIASNTGGIPEMIIDGETGLLFEKGNSDDLANKIELLVNNKKLLQKTRDKEREWGRKMWSSKVLANNLSHQYQKLLRSNNHGS